MLPPRIILQPDVNFSNHEFAELDGLDGKLTWIELDMSMLMYTHLHSYLDWSKTAAGSLEWAFLTKIIFRSRKCPPLRLTNGFHSHRYPLDISSRRHDQRPTATKLHLDAFIKPIMLPLRPPPPPPPRVVVYHTCLLEPRLRPNVVEKPPRNHHQSTRTQHYMKSCTWTRSQPYETGSV